MSFTEKRTTCMKCIVHVHKYFMNVNSRSPRKITGGAQMTQRKEYWRASIVLLDKKSVKTVIETRYIFQLFHFLFFLFTELMSFIR